MSNLNDSFPGWGDADSAPAARPLFRPWPQEPTTTPTPDFGRGGFYAPLPSLAQTIPANMIPPTQCKTCRGGVLILANASCKCERCGTSIWAHRGYFDDLCY